MNPPILPPSAPFSPEQRAWLNGFLAGWLAQDQTPSHSSAPPAEPLLILFGSQTGTAEKLARRMARQAPEHGFVTTVMELNACPVASLKDHKHLLIVTSTWGDGDPPDNAADFWHQLAQALPLPHIRFSVLALGDRNYSDFCGAGRKFDERLAALGAQRVHPRADCDVEYENTASTWMSAVWAALASDGPHSGTQEPTTDLVATHTVAGDKSQAAPRLRTTLNARLVGNRKLNGPGSAKETRHFEIALPPGAATYEVGDALGIEPSNCPARVAELLKALNCDGEEAVPDANEQETSLRHALLNSYSITSVQPSLLEAVAQRTADSALQDLLRSDSGPTREAWLAGREILDLLLAYPGARFQPREFVAYLRKLQPRLYSIASSPKAHPDQVHLTVNVVRYTAHGRQRHGVCSTFLADRVNPDTNLPVFFQPARHFRLPADPTRSILMIGPGTGIAPFRAFLHERRVVGAKGRNWLFFGDQKAALDFLYREELQSFLQDGTLHRLDTAFSRDQPEKVYVQQRLLENSAEVYAWLESGAHLYVCGDAKRMAKDVDAALQTVIERESGKTAEHAAEYLRTLRNEHRYQRDVY